MDPQQIIFCLITDTDCPMLSADKKYERIAKNIFSFIKIQLYSFSIHPFNTFGEKKMKTKYRKGEIKTVF